MALDPNIFQGNTEVREFDQYVQSELPPAMRIKYVHSRAGALAGYNFALGEGAELMPEAEAILKAEELCMRAFARVNALGGDSDE